MANKVEKVIIAGNVGASGSKMAGGVVKKDQVYCFPTIYEPSFIGFSNGDYIADEIREKPLDVIRGNGRVIYIGDNSRYTPFVRGAAGEDRFLSEEYYLLNLSLMTKMLTANDIEQADVSLILGLPGKLALSSMVDKLKEKFLSGKGKDGYSWECGGKVEFSISEIKFLNESLGTYFQAAALNREVDSGRIIMRGDLSEQTVGIVDIGARTLNLIIVDKGQEVQHSIHTRFIGTLSVLDSLVEDLRNIVAGQVGGTSAPDAITLGWMIASKTVPVGGKDYYFDLLPILKERFHSLADAVCNEVNTAWSGDLRVRLNRIILTGGGSLLLYQMLRSRFIPVSLELTSDAISDNADGLLRALAVYKGFHFAEV